MDRHDEHMHSRGCSHAGHGHGHSQHGGTDGSGSAFFIAVVLNAAFVAVEFSFGLVANSKVLMVDAGHNLSDVFGLLQA